MGPTELSRLNERTTLFARFVLKKSGVVVASAAASAAAAATQSSFVSWVPLGQMDQLVVWVQSGRASISLQLARVVCVSPFGV